MLHVPNPEFDEPSKTAFGRRYGGERLDIAVRQALEYVLGVKRTAACLFLVSLGYSLAAKQNARVSAQGNSLLPDAVEVSGVVEDQEGKPVADAWIDHAMLAAKDAAIPADGRFHFKTRAPAFVVRKLGYQGVFVKVPPAGPPRIVLKPVQQSLPVCDNPPPCQSLNGWDSHFCFPKIAGVELRRRGHDVDYGEAIYTLNGHRGKTYLQHGSGPTWSFGVPLDEDVWSSVEYLERAYRASGVSIVDARGKTVSGSLWRYLGVIGESATYRDAESAAAELFDRMLDGVCMLPRGAIGD